MNKEELISCLDRARNGVVKVNNDEEGDFVVKKLKEFGSVCLDSKLPSETKPQYPICIGTGDNDWWTYSYGNLNVIKFEEFKKIVESEDKTPVQITVNTKEELITQLQNGNVGIRLEGEEEGEYLINWMKKNNVIYINDDNTSGSNIEHGDIIGVTECCGKYVWDFEDENEVKLVITFKRFKEIIELKEDENNTKNDVCVISDNTWTMETVESKIKESTKVDPPTNDIGNPFDLLNSKRSPLSLYSIEELENELERRKEERAKKLEEYINKSFKELMEMGYKIHNAYSDDNMDGGINVSIEKKEVLIS